MKFQVYQIAPSHGWFWQVVNIVGPAFIIVCKSGRGFTKEQDAIDDYKTFVKWACQQPGPTPPAEAA